VGAKKKIGVGLSAYYYFIVDPLKGLSREMGLAFDNIHGQFYA
jgi:hypothetical protein